MKLLNAPASNAGFEEVEHTADWAYRIWGTTPEDLMIQAAQGLYTLAGVQLATDTSENRTIDIKGIDAESLLIAWLNELLHLRDSDNLGVYSLQFQQLDSQQLVVNVACTPIQKWIKDIKAATYHNLAIRSTSIGLEVTIVLDV